MIPSDTQYHEGVKSTAVPQNDHQHRPAGQSTKMITKPILQARVSMLKWIRFPVAVAVLVESLAKALVVIGLQPSLRAVVITTISKTIRRAVLASNLKWNTPKKSSRTNAMPNPTSNVMQMHFSSTIPFHQSFEILYFSILTGRKTSVLDQMQTMMYPTSPTPCSSPAVVCPCGCGDEEAEHRDNYVVRKAQTQMVIIFYFFFFKDMN